MRTYLYMYSVIFPCPEIREFADKALEAILRRLDRNSGSERVHVLDGQIREAICEIEDILEFHESNQFLSQSENHPSSSFNMDMQEIKQDIDSFTQLVKRLKDEYINELCNSSSLPGVDDTIVSGIYFVGNKSKMVGLSHQFSEIKNYLLTHWNNRMNIAQLVGMAGIGKTTLAKELFEDKSILEWFELRAWVRVGLEYKLEKILQCIMAQVNPDANKIYMEGDSKLAEHFFGCLKGRRYLIVLDDVDDNHIWDHLTNLLPEDQNGSRVLVTTRRGGVNTFVLVQTRTYKLPFLNKEESWDLLRQNVFGEESCPHQLKKVGEKIAENCDGLPLTIATVASLLSKAPRTVEYWEKVAEKQSYVFMDAYDQMTKVLLPSYLTLPQHLKAYFLYMGVFPQRYEVPLSELIKLWCAEGFLEPDPDKDVKDSGESLLKELVSRSLVVVRKHKSKDKIKTCRLHSSFWHLCKREAGKNKFFHVLNTRADGSAKEIKNQQRLCIHKNILFGIEDVYKSMASISTTRSLLCTGPHHQYPVPICPDLRLLRVIDALTIPFYEFPEEVLKLVQLRYLALICNRKLPDSISKLVQLRYLQFLIIRRYLSIKSSGADELHLPIEIWDMKELKHLQIMGSDLPDPRSAFLPNLLTLLDVSPHSCTQNIFEGLPNLKKLGIRIELAPDVVEPLSCFDHVSHLHNLESLKCVVVNPIFKCAPPTSTIFFPESLKKLSLSGLGYPWKYMRVIASLPNLEVLKLRCYAFRGPKWETDDEGFWALKFLLIEDTDLVQWTTGCGSFHYLKHITLRNCYKLEELPREFGSYISIIELIDCNPLAVISAKQIKENHSFPDTVHVNAHSSLDDENLKS
ncbi:hypothetical protein DH2020_012902 [Rehmannia glutinosa]|uniref:NB-ARC domain-containing protein n=1 Tax=Rehmannia glutinosa TaxID=99300 RepID=A0ABR0X0P7_REHGL